jgi:polyhydroxyalkanoate synthesis regulator phasin
MSKTEILTELGNLKAHELAEVQAKLDELAGDSWIDNGELSLEDKAALDAALVEYQQHPDAGSSWEEVKARIQAKLGR